MRFRLILITTMVFLNVLSVPVLLAQGNRVLSLDGDGDYVEADNLSGLGSQQNTLEFWVNPTLTKFVSKF